ncbi:trans-aconitate 2-methyltransferase [Prosthecomicrobium pneumaticum]|nr:trans-aconitate 2-methyltransferase [Prosthecomicrobium pneumaticum]
MKDWSAETYLRFEDERTRPSRDLLAQVPLLRPTRIVDLGCGPGNSTELLAARYPHAEVTGLDSSPDMLAAARKRLPAGRFVEGDIASWTPDAPVDLLFANAVFQWVPDHLGALTRLFGGLPKGAVLAVQMPDNQAEPSHAAMRATAASGSWAARFAAPIAREPILPPRAYFEALGPFATRLDVWHTIYQHPLAGPEAIVDWVMGTGLRPFLDRLDAAERAPFLAAYTSAIAAAYPPLADGRVLFRFPRLFIVAVRGE